MSRAALEPSEGPGADYLHCPFFLRSSIVCMHHDVQPCPAPPWGWFFWHILIQALASQLAASAGGAKAAVRLNTNRVVRNASIKRMINISLVK
jgi:hypothetical protein